MRPVCRVVNACENPQEYHALGDMHRGKSIIYVVYGGFDAVLTLLDAILTLPQYIPIVNHIVNPVANPI